MKNRGPAKCRVCGKALVTGPERTLGRCRTCPSDFDIELWEALKRWRVDTAKARGVPAYIVFGDVTLREMARDVPLTPAALSEITGVGAKKLEQFGDAFLEAIREYARSTGSGTDPGSRAPA